jgi:hypothetical protein
MDPVTVILGALAAANAAIGDQVIKDGYAALRKLIRDRFGDREPDLDRRLDDYATNPRADAEQAAAEALRKAGADQEQQVVDDATALLRKADALQPGIWGGLVGQINAEGGRVVVARDIDTLNM